MEKVTIELPKEQATDLLFLQEYFIFNEIRENEDIDNIEWLRKQLDLYDAIAHAIGEPDTMAE